MKLLYFIIGLFIVMVDICIFFTVVFICLISCHWLLDEIKAVYPDLYMSDLFRAMLFIGCMMIGSWVLRKIYDKPTMKVRYDEKVTENEIQ